MDQIHHWQSYFGVLDAAHGGTRTLDEHAQRHPNGMLDATPPAQGVSSGAKVEACVSGSCWIVECPDCGGAEFVNFDDLRFFCCACRNAKTRHKPRAVIAPDDELRRMIEETLLKRSDPRTRNWTSDETIDDLEAENLEQEEALS